MYTTIKTLWEQGCSKLSIAKMTKLDWKTVNKVINLINQGIKEITKKPHPSLLDPHKSQILEWLEQDLTGIRIHEKLTELGTKISYSNVKYYISNLKESNKNNICVRFHTGPGIEAQVDFGYVGYQIDQNNKLRKAWVFNMRLSFSRLDYYEIVFDQTVATFIKCHMNAFEYFYGVPEIVKIDNLKAAIIKADFYEPVYQRQYLQFAKYYQFSLVPCRVRQPQEKGKTESGIKFFKSNFIKGRNFNNYIELNFILKNWLEKSNSRIHGTTRKQPIELFNHQEKECLKTLPSERFKLNIVGTRLVSKDCHINIDYNYYSVPYKYSGKAVEIEIEEKLIRIFHEGQQITLHEKSLQKGEFLTKENHYPPFKLITSQKNKEYYQEKMLAIGEDTASFFIIIIKEQPNYWLNTIRGILSLSKLYSNDIINKSCQRALAYNALTYKSVKSICSSGCYIMPIELNK